MRRKHELGGLTPFLTPFHACNKPMADLWSASWDKAVGGTTISAKPGWGMEFPGGVPTPVVPYGGGWVAPSDVRWPATAASYYSGLGDGWQYQ